MENKIGNLWWREELEDLLGKYHREEIESPEIVLYVYRVIQAETINNMIK